MNNYNIKLMGKYNVYLKTFNMEKILNLYLVYIL